jgi:hypothetical protein
MKVVYSLRDDLEGLRHMQAGSSSPGPIGLKQTHGLIGSPEWWAHIDHGTLPVTRHEGTIKGFWPGQGGQGPAEFELSLDVGGSYHSLCYLEPTEAGTVFALGRRAAVETVKQQLKTEYEGSRDSHLVVRILVGEPHAA